MTAVFQPKEAPSTLMERRLWQTFPAYLGIVRRTACPRCVTPDGSLDGSVTRPPCEPLDGSVSAARPLLHGAGTSATDRGWQRCRAPRREFLQIARLTVRRRTTDVVRVATVSPRSLALCVVGYATERPQALPRHRPRENASAPLLVCDAGPNRQPAPRCQFGPSRCSWTAT
jgi:hypothetical protein